MSDAIRVQNFDTIRIVAAVSVIFSHAFLIADGHERNEPLVQLLGKGNILGIYGVLAFLIVSGFLVTHSFQTSPSLGAYFWKRFLRIYPGLALSAVVSAFVIAPFFAVGAVDIGQHTAYVRDVLAMQEVWFIPGVSFYGAAKYR